MNALGSIPFKTLAADQSPNPRSKMDGETSRLLQQCRSLLRATASKDLETSTQMMMLGSSGMHASSVGVNCMHQRSFKLTLATSFIFFFKNNHRRAGDRQ